MKKIWYGALIVGLGQILLSLPSVADEKPKKASTDTEQKISESLEKIVFVPHDVGAPKVTDTGGVRGVSAAPKLFVLAPERLSRSLSSTPTFYLYVSKDTETPVRFTLLAQDSTTVDPALEFELGPFTERGIHEVSLADHGKRLEASSKDEENRYSWSVALTSENGAFSEEPVAQTWLEHMPSIKTDLFLKTAAPFEQIAKLAREGYWYDALDLVSEQIEAGDQSHPWREIRADLLEQVGQKQAAAFDRQFISQ